MDRMSHTRVVLLVVDDDEQHYVINRQIKYLKSPNMNYVVVDDEQNYVINRINAK